MKMFATNNDVCASRHPPMTSAEQQINGPMMIALFLSISVIVPTPSPPRKIPTSKNDDMNVT
jgi:hypothetical protein